MEFTAVQPKGMHLAQINIARASHDLDSPAMRDFVGALAAVNAKAERSPGFVWRLIEDPDAPIPLPTDADGRLIVNMSVWETPETFEEFVWKTVHVRVYERRARWFDSPSQAHFAMWWVEAGQPPTVEDAFERLAHLRANGPSERAFGWEALPSVKLWREKQCG